MIIKLKEKKKTKSIKGGDQSVYGSFFFNAQHILLSNNWGMWWICAASDGNDDDNIVDDGWKSEFDDTFIVE